MQFSLNQFEASHSVGKKHLKLCYYSLKSVRPVAISESPIKGLSLRLLSRLGQDRLEVRGRSNQSVKYLICCTALEDNVCMQLYSVFTWALERRDKGICLKIRVTYFWEPKMCCDENERKQIVLLKWSDMFGFFTMYALISLFKLNFTFLYLDIKTQNC